MIKVEGTAEIESKSVKKLVLKSLLPKKITFIATAMDGSGVTATKELTARFIEISVQQNQLIKGTTLDKSRSKFILNTDSNENLGESAMEPGEAIDILEKNVSFAKPRGTYYLHAVIVDNFGQSEEIRSQAVTTNGFQSICFRYINGLSSYSDGGNFYEDLWIPIFFIMDSKQKNNHSKMPEPKIKPKKIKI